MRDACFRCKALTWSPVKSLKHLHTMTHRTCPAQWSEANGRSRHNCAGGSRGLPLLATRSGSVCADESVVPVGCSQEYKVEEPIALSQRRASAHCQPQRPPHGDANKTHLGSISNSHQALSSLVVHKGSKSPLKDLVPAVVGDAGNMRQHRCFGSLDGIEGRELQPICLDELSAIH